MKVRLYRRVPSWVCFVLFYKSVPEQRRARSDPSGTDKVAVAQIHFAILKGRGWEAHGQRASPCQGPASGQTPGTTGSPRKAHPRARTGLWPSQRGPNQMEQLGMEQGTVCQTETCNEFASNDIILSYANGSGVLQILWIKVTSFARRNILKIPGLP